MKYMMTWSIKPDCYKGAVERFLSTGAPLPEGLKQIGRWHGPGATCGWLLVEGSVEAAYEHAAEWAEFLDWKTTPVFTDEDAGPICAKVYS